MLPRTRSQVAGDIIRPGSSHKFLRSWSLSLVGMLFAVADMALSSVYREAVAVAAFARKKPEAAEDTFPAILCGDMNATPDSEISIRSGSIPLTTGRMGRKGQNIAVRVEAPVREDIARRLASQKGQT